MLDFTSSLYLGFRHSTESLRPWAQLTTGSPAALVEPPVAVAVAERLARLQGLEQATLAKSTLHLFWDLFAALAAEPIVIYLDAGVYPTAHWGVERVAARGVPVHRFAHKDAIALDRLLRQRDDHRQAVVVTDGVCSCCGCTAPLAAYLAAVRRVGGLLVVDDTQALGLLGRQPDRQAPYGREGGGSLRWNNLTGPDLLVVSSLAKGFGVPLATLSGSHTLVERFLARSKTRIHCSPPSAADLHAAERALNVNARLGDGLRSQLAQRVRYFRRLLRDAGLRASGGLFPVQTLELAPQLDVRQVHQQLADAGLQTVLRQSKANALRLTLILTARHRPAEIEQAVRLLANQIDRSVTTPNDSSYSDLTFSEVPR
jgi:8-amino-7-oxononanoate synthase